MTDEAPSRPIRQGRIELTIPAGTIEAQFPVPDELIRSDDLLPFARALSAQVVGLTVLQAENEGRTPSCGPHCGACCRQLVPISETEARMIARLVEGLPEPRRSTIKARFTTAKAQLADAGLLDALQGSSRNHWDTPLKRQFADDYFRMGLPCPFLEDESCSIHPERPITCRECLVASDPKYCKEVHSEHIDGIRMPTHVWAALARLSDTPSGEEMPPWVPLVLALEWVEEHPDEPPRKPGPELYRQFLGTVAQMIADRCRVVEPAEDDADDGVSQAGESPRHV